MNSGSAGDTSGMKGALNLPGLSAAHAPSIQRSSAQHVQHSPPPFAVVIRLCYYPDADEENVRWRFWFFEEYVLPRIVAQTVPADVWVWVHPRHLGSPFLPKGVHIFTVNLDAPSRRFEETILRGFPWYAVRGMPKYQHQVLFGSDDLIGPEFLATSLEALRRIPYRRALVTHHPLMLHWETQRVYKMREWPHRPSPFVVLRQPVNERRYDFIWDQPHTHLHKIVPRWYYIPSGHAIMVVHDYNDGTRFNPNLPEIARPGWL